MANYKSPGVYIEEQNAFPASAVQVATAIPVFIGYTQKAQKGEQQLKGRPVKLSSLAEYITLFGKGYKHTFSIRRGDAEAPVDIAGKTFRLYDSLRLFYANGGSDCYILSVGDYSDTVTAAALAGDDVWSALEKEYEPTLIIIPDAVAVSEQNEADFYTVCTRVLQHCNKMQNRFGIFDVPVKSNDDSINGTRFRDNIGNDGLSYGAAYYPWLHTTVVPEAEVNFLNLAQAAGTRVVPGAPAGWAALKGAIVALDALGLPEATAKEMIRQQHSLYLATEYVMKGNDLKVAEMGDEGRRIFDGYDQSHKDAATALANTVLALAYATDPGNAGQQEYTAFNALGLAAQQELSAAGSCYWDTDPAVISLHQGLLAVSPVYAGIMNEIRRSLNTLPPAAAMAGIYTLVDNSRGVWKAPANVSLNSVEAPVSEMSSEQQAVFNADPESGKSINVIRSFTGLGTLVWGARTLDGNSQDWRYINVRRTVIMLEQSIKLAMRAYVFEPNDANTWITIKSMISNFLTNLWKQGALAGAAPEQAFDVAIGLGATMTPDDILEGSLLVTIKVAIVHPAEFIVLTFQQMQQQA